MVFEVNILFIIELLADVCECNFLINLFITLILPLAREFVSIYGHAIEHVFLEIDHLLESLSSTDDYDEREEISSPYLVMILE